MNKKFLLLILGIILVLGLISADVSYRYVRWEVVEKKGVEASCVGQACIQTAEFVLLLNNNTVSWPVGITATNPNGANPDGEGPGNAIDRNLGTKWLDYNFNAVAGTTTGSANLSIDVGEGNTVLFNGYKWSTANDVPERDPISWVLYGSDDGSTWVELDTKNSQAITDSRNTYTTNYQFQSSDTYPKISFIAPTPNNSSSTSNNSIQINASVISSNLTSLIFNWNRTNYTIYDPSLILMMNFNNLTSLGENDTQIYDISGNENNGSVKGGANWNIYGRYNGGFDFDGVDDYISIANSQSLNMTNGNQSNYTITFWTKTTMSGSNIWSEPTFIDFRNTGDDPFEGWVFSLFLNAENKIGFITGGSISAENPSGYWDIINGSTVVNDGNWHHIVLTRENTESIKLYVDGVEDASGSSTKDFYTSELMTIGCRRNDAGVYRDYLNGSLDEIRIWNRTLSSQEVYQQYASNLEKFNSTQWYLYVNQSQNTTTGLSDGNYTYQVFAEDGSGNLNSSDDRSIEIYSSSLPSGAQLLLDWTYPTIDLNVNQTEFFNITINITCLNGNCGEVNVTLDPIGTPASCKDILEYGLSTGDGAYTVYPYGNETGLEVYCDMSTQGGGWTLVSNMGPSQYAEGLPMGGNQLTDLTTIYFTNKLGVMNHSEWLLTHYVSGELTHNIFFNYSSYENLSYRFAHLVSTGENLTWIGMNSSGTNITGFLGSYRFSHESGITESNWYSRSSLSGDDGTWGVINSTGSLNGGAGGPSLSGSSNPRFGFENPNTADSSSPTYYTGYSSSSSSNWIAHFFIREETPSSSSIKGVVSMNPNSTNFYTLTKNPYNLTLNENQSQLITWQVNATGTINSPYEFFIYANSTSNSSIGNRTSSINITILDVVSPAINLTFPLNITYNIRDISQLNYTYSDANPGYCWYSIDNGLTNSTPVIAGQNFTNISSLVLSNTWTLYCNDSSNNLNTASVTFNKIIPVIGLERIGSGNMNVNQNDFFNISVNVSCSISNCGEVNISLDPIYGTGTNYSVYNSSEILGDSFEWEDTSLTGGWILWQNTNLDDSGGVGINLPFNFNFYSNNFSRVYIVPNGRVHFDSAVSNTVISLPGNYKAVVPVNNDMYVRSSANTIVSLRNATNPNRFIIEYSNLSYYSYSSSKISYQVILYADGKIKIQYHPASMPYYASQKIGLTYDSSNHLLFPSTDAPDQYSGMALTFFPENYSFSSAKGGLISTTLGATPFYTNITNPYNLTLNQGESRIITWYVNATGTIANPYEFFVYANKTEDLETGNITSVWNVTIIDQNLPSINITYPLNTTYYTNVSTINYTYTDDNGNGYCWYSIDNGVTNSTPVTAGGGIFNVLSSDGLNTWILYCNDSSGNTNSSTITFNRDTTYPIFSNYWDNSAQLGDSGTAVFNVSIEKTNGTVWLNINNANISATNISYNVYNASYDFSNSGNYNYTWWAYGNSSSTLVNLSSTRTFIVNDTYPIFSSILLNPINGSTYLPGRNYSFNTTILNTNSTAGIEFNSINYSLINYSSVFSKNFNGLAAGVYPYYFWAFGSGSKNLLNRTQTYYYTISKITGVITPIINGSNLNFTADDLSNTNIWINLTNTTGFGTGKIYLNGSLINSGVLPLSNLTNLSVGYYNITFEYDGNQNYSSSSRVLFVNISFSDTIYPSFSNYQDNNGTISNIAGTALFNVSIEKTNGTVWLNINGTNYSASNVDSTVYNASVNGLANGTFEYYWGAFGSGTSNNINYSEIKNYYVTYIDIIPPLVTIHTPLNQTYGNSSVLINFSSSELGDKWFNFDQGINQTYSSEIYSSLSDGDYTLYAYANDSSGNTNYTMISFTVNTSLPSLLINSPLATIYNNRTLLLDISSNGQYINYNWNGTNTTYSSPLYTRFNEGENTLVAYANNSLGLSNLVSVTFTTDTTPPSLEIISPRNITYNTTRILLNLSSTNYSNIWYSWNNSNISYSSESYIEFNNGSITLFVYSNDSVGNLNYSSVMFFSYKDSDYDSIPDYADLLKGNDSSVTISGITNLNITISGNSTNGTYDNVQEILFYEDNNLFINFTHNFSESELDLSKVRLTKATNSIIINLSNQLQAEYNKTVYITDNSFIGLCVKDAEISSLSEISPNCNQANETDFTSCLGNYNETTINSTSCVDEGDRIKISNLRYSAIRGTVATLPTTTPGSGSSSGSHGGGSISKTQECTTEWKCSSWSFCSKEFTQTRTCVKLNNSCKAEEKPIEFRTCPDILFDVKVDLLDYNIYPWRDLEVFIDLKEVNQSDLLDIEVVYEILNDLDVVWSEKETIAIQNTKSYLKKFQNIDLPAGTYLVKATVNYGKSQTASSTHPFKIIGTKSILIILAILAFLILIATIAFNKYKQREDEDKIKDYLEDIDQRLTNEKINPREQKYPMYLPVFKNKNLSPQEKDILSLADNTSVQGAIDFIKSITSHTPTKIQQTLKDLEARELIQRLRKQNQQQTQQQLQHQEQSQDYYYHTKNVTPEMLKQDKTQEDKKYNNYKNPEYKENNGYKQLEDNNYSQEDQYPSKEPAEQKYKTFSDDDYFPSE